MDIDSLFIDWINAREKKDQKVIENICKDYLIKSGKYNIWRNMLFAEYSKNMALKYGTTLNKKYEMFLGVNQQFNSLEVRCCKQIYESNRKKTRRLKNKLEFLINNYDCLFLTMTFRDDVLSDTSHDTRRIYITRFLKSLNSSFGVANIDYGDRDKNPESKEREHYHGIVNLKSIDLSSYSYGFIYAEHIVKTSNPAKLSKYINKITNHSYKDSTKGCDRLIYLKSKKE